MAHFWEPEIVARANEMILRKQKTEALSVESPGRREPQKNRTNTRL
jgi:hypothetical protein